MRLRFLICLVLLSAVAVTATLPPITITLKGLVSGVDTGAAIEYRGIPYAKPPVGELRWRPPVEADSWAPSIYQATTNPPSCPQNQPVVQSEDCLYLNVYVPHGLPPRKGRPVMIFFTGGAFIQNGPAEQTFNASDFASTTGNIVVVPSYRLGILGLMGHPSFRAETDTFGNYLLMDQVKVMEWVRDNIAFFGGNNRRITLFGQSAGSISIGIHLTTTPSEGLFHRVIMESGAPSVLNSAEAYTNASARFQQRVGCPVGASDSATLACMRSVNVSTILAAQLADSYWTLPRPAVDGVFIKAQPLARIRDGAFQRRVDVMAGFQTNESTIFLGKLAAFNDLVATQAQFQARVTSLYGVNSLANISALYDISPNSTGPFSLPTPFAGMGKVDGDFNYVCPLRKFLRSLVAAGSRRVWFYRFDRNPPFGADGLGAYHTGELAYVFGRPCFLRALNAIPPLTPYGASCPEANGPSWDPSTNPADFDLSRTIMKIWGAFADNGNPNSGGYFERAADTAWEQYSANSNWANAVFDADDAAGSALVWTEDMVNEERCDYWDSRLPAF